ncbi:hypothetical protein N9V46_02335 [Flavobacteriaceae bacterium]|nr:hypothetical protein [Flavobacteriaceae bacterium]
MKYIFSLLILLTIPVLILSVRVEKSYRQQFNMLGSYNTNYYDLKSDYESIIEDYPNISVTTLPLATIKAEYFIRQNKIDDGIRLLKKGVKANPYIGASEARLSELYFTAFPNKDSAVFYAEKAYNSRPLNTKHYLMYVKSLALRNESNNLDESMGKSFNLIKKFNLGDNDLPTILLYYISTTYQYRFNNKKKYDSIAKNALKLFPRNQQIKMAANFIIYGKDSVQKALEIDEKATLQFENKNYEESFNLYSQSVNLWPNHEYSLQKAGIAAYLSENYKESIFYLEKLLEIDTPVDGITELYLFNSYKKINDSLNACKYYNKLLLLNPNLVDKNTKGCD